MMLMRPPRTALQQFAYTVTQIIDAGLPACPEWGIRPSPYFVLFDDTGKRWQRPPWLMSRDDILEYVRARWPQFANELARTPHLTLH
jgi:hypothetical protein